MVELWPCPATSPVSPQNWLTTVSFGRDGDIRIDAAGALDMASRREMLAACVQDGNRTVVVDLANLSFMDCAGYGALVEARTVLEDRGGWLSVAHATGEPARLLGLIAETCEA